VGPVGVSDVVVGSWALVYRDKTSFDVALPASLAIEGAEVNAVFDVLVLANFMPRTLTSGVSLQIVRDVLVDLEAQYVFWSEAPPPAMISSIDLGGKGLDSLGLEGGLDAPAEGQERVTDPAFQDTVVLRAGIEAEVVPDILAVRAGYQYRPTPVPDQTSGTNIIDCTTHVFAGGFGLTFDIPMVFARPLTIDAAYQAQVLEPRRAEKTNRQDDVGDWTASGAVHSLAVGWTYQF
jgi:long-subunit fatty acid transport protein